MTTLNPDDVAALASIKLAPPEMRRQLRVNAILSFTAPKYARKSVAEVAAMDPAAGPKYRRTQHGRVLTNYSVARVRQGIERMLAEATSAIFDPAITEVALQARIESVADGRLASFERSHDITDLSKVVAGIASDLATHRKRWQRATEPALRARRSVRKALPRHVRKQFSPQGAIQAMVRVAVLRWLPAVANIVARLPAQEQEQAADAANATMRAHLILLGRLHTLTADDREEYARWEYGFGAVDLAIIESAMLIGEANELVLRVVDDGSDTGMLSARIRRTAADAWTNVLAHLEQAAFERAHVMGLDAWLYNKSEIVDFARADGGMEPALEVLFHARGSKFNGYC